VTDGALDLVKGLCAELEEAMRVLRFGTEAEPLVLPGHTAVGDEVHEALLDVRARLDLAEELMTKARGERRRFRAKAAQRQAERDEEYDRVMVKLGEGAVRREYEGTKDREAKARVHVLELTQTANRAAAARVMVDDCFDGLKDTFFGLLNIREELIARLRELQFESALER
jgi:hypothetical protein